MAFMAWGGDTLELLFQAVIERVNSLGDANTLVARILHKAAPRRMTGQGAPGMSWSTMYASLPFSWRDCASSSGAAVRSALVAAAGVPSVTVQGCHC